MKKLFLFALVLCSTALMAQNPTWIGKSYIVANGTWYNASGTGNADFNSLGTIEDLKISGQIQSYQDADGEHNPAFMKYRFDDASEWKEIELKWFKYADNNNWFGTADGTGLVLADGFGALADGPHTLEIYFYKPTTSDKIYDNNSGANYKATFTKGHETPEDFTYKVKVPAGTAECYIAGDWNKDGNWVWKKMEADGTDQFKYAVTGQLKSFKYKYCSAADWDHKELKADDSDVPDRTFGDSVDIVAKFKAPKPIEFKSKAFEYAAGMNFVATTNPDSLVIEVTYPAALVDSFIIVSDKLYKIAGDAEMMTRANCTDWGLMEDAEGTKDVAIKIDQAGKYTYIWKPSVKKVSVIYPAQVKQDIIYKAAAPAGTTACFIAGDWNGDGNWVWKEMKVVDAVDHQFEYEAKDQLASFEYKYCSAASWDNVELTAEGGDVDNRTYTGAIDVIAKFKTPAEVKWYIKLPVAKDDWTWREMDEEANGTWAHQTKWVGGGANVGTEMDDSKATYIKDEDMNFGENKVAPAEGTECTFVWDPVTKVLAVNYVAPQGIENISYQLDLNAPIYNVLGVEVDASFHGVVIQNGQKFIR